jgi:hypothetical protein
MVDNPYLEIAQNVESSINVLNQVKQGVLCYLDNEEVNRTSLRKLVAVIDRFLLMADATSIYNRDKAAKYDEIEQNKENKKEETDVKRY